MCMFGNAQEMVRKATLQTDAAHDIHIRGRRWSEAERGKRLLFISLLLLSGWPFQRDTDICYLYNYRNIRNEMLKKLLLKLMWFIEVQVDRYDKTVEETSNQK